MFRRFNAILRLMLIIAVTGDRAIDRLRRLFGRTIRSSPSSLVDNEESLNRHTNQSGERFGHINSSVSTQKRIEFTFKFLKSVSPFYLTEHGSATYDSTRTYTLTYGEEKQLLVMRSLVNNHKRPTGMEDTTFPLLHFGVKPSLLVEDWTITLPADNNADAKEYSGEKWVDGLERNALARNSWTLRETPQVIFSVLQTNQNEVEAYIHDPKDDPNTRWWPFK